MIDFKTAVGTTMPVDPAKRVNYVPGLVLGADEFIQAHAYLSEKHRLHNRLLHGYGTISGLAVVTPEPGETILRIEAGWAVDQRGREIAVPYTMCVDLDKWLQRHRPGLEAAGFSGGGDLALCVMLRYRECEADTVPVPGEPCRSQDDVMQASRVADSFELELCVAPVHHAASPPAGDELCCCPAEQPEEDAVRRFGELLERIEVTGDVVTYATVDQLVAEIHRLGEGAGVASLPGGPLYLPPAQACAMLHEALRVWVTTVRPALLARELGDECDNRERGVLLADLTLHVTSGWLLGPGTSVVETRRPWLLHTRLLQEWLLCGRVGRGGEVPAFVFATPVFMQKTIGTVQEWVVRVWVHHDVLVDIPAAAVRLDIDGRVPNSLAIDRVAPTLNVFDVRPVGWPTSFGAPPWPPTAGTRVTITFHAATMTERRSLPRSFIDILNAPGHEFIDRFGDELRVYAMAPAAPVVPPLVFPVANSDVTGTYPTLAVAKLQGRSIAATAPSIGAQLAWNGTAWTPALPAGDIALGAAFGTLKVTGLQVHPVSATAPAHGQALVAPAAGQWAPGFVTGAVGAYTIVAAGVFNGDGSNFAAVPPYGHAFTCQPVVGKLGEYDLFFADFDANEAKAGRYIVKGTPRVRVIPPFPAVGHTITPPLEIQSLGSFAYVGESSRGLRVRVLGAHNAAMKSTESFMVEISYIGLV